MRANVFLLLFLLFVTEYLFSQNGYFYIKGENFIQTSGYIVIQDLNWKNSGNENLYSGSYVKFNGSSLQQITGDSVTTFAGLIVNNTGGGVYLDQNIEVKDTLKIISGYFDLKDKMADFGTTGYLTGENEYNRVRATDASGTEGLGTGVCKATRLNPTGNVAGFGLDFTPSISMGTTEIYRGHLRQAGSNFDNANGGYSILRYYEIHPQNYTTIQINPFNYFDAELNNITPESDLKIMQLQTAPNIWQMLPTSLNTTLNTATGSTISNSLNYIKITLAKAGCKLTAQINATPNPVCEGGSVQLTTTNNNAIGNVYYNWSGPNGFSSSQPNPILSNVTTANSGIYYVTVTDDINCTSTAQITININSLPMITATSNSPICSGATLQLNASDVNQGSYQWSGPESFSSSIQNPQITNVTTNNSGIYIVTVTDANGCSSTSSINVTINQTPIVNAGNDQNINTGTSTQLNGSISGGSGSYTYYWQPGNLLNDSTILNPTTQILTETVIFNLIVIDNVTGCSDTDHVVIQVGGQTLSADITANPQIICYGQSAQLNVNASGGSGTYTYTWASNPPGFSSNQPNPIVNPTETTTYYVTVDDGYLQVTQSVTITVNSLPDVTITGTTTICEQSALQLTATGGNTYNWSGPNGFSSTNATIQITNATTQNSGTYSVTVTDVNGCTSTQSVDVTVNTLPDVTITGTTTICEQSALQLTATGGNTYNWSGPNGFSSTNATIQITNATTQNSGTYSVTVTDVNGCTNTYSVNVTVNTLPIASITGNTTYCEGETISLNGGSGTTYNWTGPNSFTSTNQEITINNATPSNSGQYIVAVSNTCGTVYDTVNIIVNPKPSLSVQSNSPVCEGQSITITATGTGNFSWVGPGGFTSTSQIVTITNATQSNSGNYVVTLTDVNGCTNSVSVNVVVQQTPNITITGNVAVCAGSTLELVAQGGTSYQWAGPNNFTSNTNNIFIPNTTSQNEGTYYVTVSNGVCTSTSSVYVDIIPLPAISVTGDTLLLIGNSTQLIASGADIYQWTPVTNLSCTNCANPIASPTSTTTYCVIGTQNGCSDSACIKIIVDENCGELFIPEAFSPNGDGKHDTWSIRGRCIKEIELVIFDRWGEKVFETTDPTETWDGTYRNKPMDTDIYVFVARVVLITGEEKKFKGDITLIR